LHPAYSVIVFTTASGAGYGLMALLCLFGLGGALPATTGFGAIALGLSATLIVSGLMSSTLHLGRPERALRAFSQWRSSWLSREGVAAVAGFVPFAVTGIGWVFFNDLAGVFALGATLSVAFAVLTVVCTAMIYASLKPIRQWRQAWTPLVYLALAAMTGALLLVGLTLAFGLYRPLFAETALGLAVVAAGCKGAYWRRIAAWPATSTIETATGLSRLGKVRLLDAPHTEENYVMREMGFVIARAHARKLRLIAAATLFAAPAALIALVVWFAADYPLLGFAAALIAIVSAGVGVLIERWLFFAEATHVAILYYGGAG
jgi:DMSO reductase anchor subunit